MNVISAEFALLAFASAIVYYLLNHKYRTAYLAILSSAFIASFNYLLLPYIIVYSLTNYFIGLKIPDSKKKLTLYRTGILINLVQLIVIRVYDALFHNGVYGSKAASPSKWIT